MSGILFTSGSSACWEIGQHAGGTHPTGIHTCAIVISVESLESSAMLCMKITTINFIQIFMNIFFLNINSPDIVQQSIVREQSPEVVAYLLNAHPQHDINPEYTRAFFM